MKFTDEELEILADKRYWGVLSLDEKESLVFHGAAPTVGEALNLRPEGDHSSIHLVGWESVEAIRQEMIYHRDLSKNFDEDYLNQFD